MKAAIVRALAVAAWLLAGCAARDPWTFAAGQHPQSFQRTVQMQVKGQLLLFLPADFKVRKGIQYPLLIFLHGAGEAGTDLDKLMVQGPPRIVTAEPEFPFIVASPQAPRSSGGGFDPVMLDAMLDELLERLPIDPHRVYLTGLSMGGFWSYGWASMHPERFAAVAPVCGAWDPVDACQLRNVPIWAFHGARDDVVPLDRDEAMVAAVKACGGDIRLTVYPDAGHDAWTAAYADPELYAWFLRHRRAAAVR